MYRKENGIMSDSVKQASLDATNATLSKTKSLLAGIGLTLSAGALATGIISTGDLNKCTGNKAPTLKLVGQAQFKQAGPNILEGLFKARSVTCQKEHVRFARTFSENV